MATEPAPAPVQPPSPDRPHRAALATRRACLQAGLATLAGLGAGQTDSHAAPSRTTDKLHQAAPQLLATWQEAAQHRVGLWQARGQRLHPGAALNLPTRAHGLLAEPGGSLLVVARRPGDWLLRWHPAGAAQRTSPATGTRRAQAQTQWCWMDDDQRLNGHVVRHPQRPWLITTETDRASGQGRLGVRHADTLIKWAEWSSHGLDPHQLLHSPEPLGPWPAGTLLVANGGIPSQAERGRARLPQAEMDPSLVALHPDTGALLGQWRLPDPRLSIRHLAWQPAGPGRSPLLGIALQAEHDDPVLRAQAPVLACWDGSHLWVPEALSPAATQPLQGYGGDICALPGGGFAVSCPRAAVLACFDHQGQLTLTLAQPQACALARWGEQVWSGGQPQVLRLAPPQAGPGAQPAAQISAWHWPGATGVGSAGVGPGQALQLDNHWLAL